MKISIFALIALFVCVQSTFANHGPGTSGGGSSTISGETLKPGAWDFSIREDYTRYETINQAGAERRAISAEEFDAIRSTSVTSLGVSYGIVEDLQVSAQIGYYAGEDFIDAARTGPTSAESSTADPSGLSDLSLNLKYRIMRNQSGNLAIVGGVIAPTGRTDVKLLDGERLEPSSQPGTGAWGFQGGVGFSRFLSPRVTTDLSALYTHRTSRNNFSVGDRLDLGAAVAYRLTESIKTFPNYSIFGELNGIWIGHDEDGAEENPNSGGWTLYLTPGGKVRFNEHVSLMLAPSFPVFQDLNGTQIESRFRFSATLSLSF